MTQKSYKITFIDLPSDIIDVKVYLKKLMGSKILVIEETTTSQWLYSELRALVDRMTVCDPYRNKLLNDWPKTDKIDAAKLVHLLKAGLIKKKEKRAYEEKFLGVFKGGRKYQLYHKDYVKWYN